MHFSPVMLMKQEQLWRELRGRVSNKSVMFYAWPLEDSRDAGFFASFHSFHNLTSTAPTHQLYFFSPHSY